MTALRIRLNAAVLGLALGLVPVVAGAGISLGPAGGATGLRSQPVPTGEIAPAVVGQAAAFEPRIAPQHSRPFGRSYGQWVVAWWRWALGTPASVSPLLEPDSTNCAAGRQPERVRFLGGTFTGAAGDPPVERRCTVDAGTAFFLPVLNGVYASTPAPNPGGCPFAADPWYGTRPGDPAYREFLRLIYRPAGVDPDNPKGSLTLAIDGKAVPGVHKWYLRSPAFFDALLPDDNVFDAVVSFDCYDRIRLSPNVGYGYWAFVHPLPPGRHTIRWTADAVLPFLGDAPLHQDVTYHITVRPRR